MEWIDRLEAKDQVQRYKDEMLRRLEESKRHLRPKTQGPIKSPFELPKDAEFKNRFNRAQARMAQVASNFNMQTHGVTDPNLILEQSVPTVVQTRVEPGSVSLGGNENQMDPLSAAVLEERLAAAKKQNEMPTPEQVEMAAQPSVQDEIKAAQTKLDDQYRQDDLLEKKYNYEKDLLKIRTDAKNEEEKKKLEFRYQQEKNDEINSASTRLAMLKNQMLNYYGKAKKEDSGYNAEDDPVMLEYKNEIERLEKVIGGN